MPPTQEPSLVNNAGAGLGLRPEGRSSLWMEREEIDYSEDSRLRILFLIPGPAPESPARFNRR